MPSKIAAPLAPDAPIVNPAAQFALPPFEFVSAAHGLFTGEEMDALIARHSGQLAEGWLEKGQTDPGVRRSKIAFLKMDEYRWLYERVWDAAKDFNRRAFGMELLGIRSGIQIARYDAADQGFYTWHMDFSNQAPERKLSMTVQLSDPADYDGGELQFSMGAHVQTASKERGLAIAFPSFAMHRVAPVTRGVRWSLVAWIAGPRWR